MPKKPINIRLDEDLLAGIEQLQKNLDYPVDRTAIIERAIRELLQREGVL
ncbi:ribbon-helix-helix domain-containing protein [Ruegeria sp. WL0004]|uniref:Ribbon-helix-helix domain-containing protein n=1 Tax=Ruegeria marisflavi TaxID=2984152 RepID=A0ABT2WZ30_9RHOB|nr:ribbon-helix-helix domain-containing protein [Ruegeria sp. WL0004]MCU9840522.1 ribbon-helix-helix domain-containing protein [Ruegeria sp. WL0004]